MPNQISGTSYALTRRRALLLGASWLATAAWNHTAAQDQVSAPLIGLDEFMRLSRALTDTDDLRDEGSGRQYLAALLERPDGARRLSALWLEAGFDSAQPPTSVDDLVARGIYGQPELRELADTIAGNWYSGIYLGPDGEPRVATYTNALAWRALDYRPAGPSACAGAFGHWAERPAGA